MEAEIAAGAGESAAGVGAVKRTAEAGGTGAAAGTDPTGGRMLFWEYGEQLAVREGKWKLVLNGKLDFSRTAIDAVHLSDVDADPGERINLAEKHPDMVRRLEEAVRHWYGTLREETIRR
ncbi:hypothetical protein ACHHV8_28675 [Paenibacillus sp. TAB 01]|uniref:hypothetical protein n=1 Tax=Paenibacillus sp. TAB 01 TaxID=3368988 RepID=UPI003753CA9F